MNVTIISEWDLICDRAWLPSATQSALMIGMFVSFLFISPLSDRFGRKPIFLFGLILEIIAGIGAAVSQSITQFMIARFLVGISATTRTATSGIMSKSRSNVS